jgi:tetraacyldisaccharide 4'-kinase
MLYPISLIYSTIQTQRRKRGSANSFRFDKPIISIGNVVSGGSGKTPLTLYIAEYYLSIGLKPAISHRGYKGQYEANPTLISDRDRILPLAIDAGDEAYLLASNLEGVPVVVGKNRKSSVRLLLQTFPDTDVVILDDSFQHLAVHHDLDIITFNAEIGLGNGFVLPAGYLREPLSSIKKNHIAVINKKNPDTDSSDLDNVIAKHTNRLFCTQIRFSGFFNCAHEAQGDIDPKAFKAISICGIANPASFDIMLESYGFSLAHSFHFVDHYDYANAKQIEQICSYIKANSIDLILSTEKDIMKISKHSSLAELALYPKLQIEIDDESSFKELLGSVLA